jgi:hypothetical protein
MVVTTAEAMEELKQAWRDLGLLVLVTLANTWLGRRIGLPKAIVRRTARRD